MGKNFTEKESFVSKAQKPSSVRIDFARKNQAR